MWNRLAVSMANYALARSNLTIEQRNSLTMHIMDGIGALPFNDIIYVSDEGLVINNRSLSVDEMRQLRESAGAALNNQALTLIRQQATYEAITLGVHKVQSEKELLFARAAIWFGSVVEAKLKILAQRSELGTPQD